MRKSLPSRNRSRSRRRIASADLTQFIKKQYPTKLPIAMITSISKLYCKNKPSTKQSKIIKRFAQSQTHVNTPRFVQYLTTENDMKKGTQLTDEWIKKIYQGNCNPEGKLSFQYIMKMGEQTGFPVSEKVAKGIVRMYGKRKDFINLEQCQKVVKRRYANINSRRFSPAVSPRSHNR